MLRIIILCVASVLLVSIGACTPSPEDALADMLAADNMEEFNRSAYRAGKLGEQSIPLFTAVLEDSFKNRYSVFSWGKTGTSLNYLHEMAMEGIYTVDEVPILINAIRNQISVSDTLVIANTLEIITGVDAGWDEEFIENYEVGDAEKLFEKIEIWEEWYEKQASD